MKRFREFLTEVEVSGDCFVAAFRYQMDNPKALLVHGLVTGQGPIEGVVYPHAWNEEGDEAIDTSMGRNIRLPKSAYYALGKISHTVKYTHERAIKVMEKNNLWTYGPWTKHLVNFKIDLFKRNPVRVKGYIRQGRRVQSHTRKPPE